MTKWGVYYTRRDLPIPVELPQVLQDLSDFEAWLDDADIPDGTPFLLSPAFDYDVELNVFFTHRAQMLGAPWNTQAAYARDLGRFLTFLHTARGGKGWRDATEDDHLAYLVWRRWDPVGPRVEDATWDREVALVNQFFAWAVRRGHVRANPITQRDRRPAPAGTLTRRAQAPETDTAPATYSHGAAAERMTWLPPSAYRRWRDVGLRGHTSAGLLQEGFRGRWAARNATFADLMVRTGLRLTEQASLTVFELPTDRGLGGYQRFWLPKAIAKGGSARWVYVPESLTGELAAYLKFDRAEVVEHAQVDGRYERLRRSLVIDDPARLEVSLPGAAGTRHRTPLARLTPEERRRLLVATPAGLEPAMFWLNEDGWPLTVSGWKDVFAKANQRCAAHGVPLAISAHALRHSFAVVCLEQLQRGQVSALAELSPEQRGHYTRIFGDPLDWVRRRLGHRSLQSTLIYLHALQELEMHTRMALVPDAWEDPRDTWE